MQHTAQDLQHKAMDMQIQCTGQANTQHKTCKCRAQGTQIQRTGPEAVMCSQALCIVVAGPMHCIYRPCAVHLQDFASLVQCIGRPCAMHLQALCIPPPVHCIGRPGVVYLQVLDTVVASSGRCNDRPCLCTVLAHCLSRPGALYW